MREMNTGMEVNGNYIEASLGSMVIGLEYPSFPKSDEEIVSQEIANHIYDKRKEFVASMKYIEGMITAGPFDCNKVKNGDLKRYEIISELFGDKLCIFDLGFSNDTGVINIELSPNKLYPCFFVELSYLFSILFDGHYSELYQRGLAVQAEFIIDVHGKCLSDMVLIDLGRRTTSKLTGTTYQGGGTSRLVGTMYDQAAQKEIGRKLAHIEARINRRDIHFKDFVEKDQFNPFSDFLAVDVSTLQLVEKKWKRPHLAKSIQEFGLYDVIADRQTRNAIGRFLKEKAVPWWQPEWFWATHKNLLMKLKPDLLESPA